MEEKYYGMNEWWTKINSSNLPWSIDNINFNAHRIYNAIKITVRLAASVGHHTRRIYVEKRPRFKWKRIGNSKRIIAHFRNWISTKPLPLLLLGMTIYNGECGQEDGGNSRAQSKILLIPRVAARMKNPVCRGRLRNRCLRLSFLRFYPLGLPADS